mgnify:CR=1 FL=1
MVKLGALTNVEHYGPPVASYNDLTVQACFKCGIKHLSPLPNPNTLTRFYTDPDGFYKNAERRFAIDASHHHQGLWDALYRWESSRLALHLGPCTRLIDLGAGTGWFVKWWADNVGRAVGVEPSPVARSHSPVPARLFPTLEESSRKFAEGNPVYLRARLVLEHLVDPVGFLREAVGIPQQVKGIIITVPSDFNPLQERIIRRDGVGHWFIDKTHINYFDQRGLDGVLREAGFEAVWWGATAPLEVFQLWLGHKYIGDDRIGQRVHLTRLKFEKATNRLAFRLYGLLFNRLGWGREIICVAKKVE